MSNSRRILTKLFDDLSVLNDWNGWNKSYLYPDLPRQRAAVFFQRRLGCVGHGEQCQ